VKIYLTKPRNHWISPYKILEKIFFWREIDYDEPIIDRWANRLEPFSKTWQKFLDIIHPEINYIKIDYWDTWSMDTTLSPIILPMLIQLQKTKHGSPQVDDEDVPENIRSISAPSKKNDWDTDDNWFKRWDWVMDEMIWTFEQLSKWDNDSKFFDHSEVNKDEKDLLKQVSKIKCDQEGLVAHNARIANGLRLFGKYYRGLWD
jgi:hypothetical protein